MVYGLCVSILQPLSRRFPVQEHTLSRPNTPHIPHVSSSFFFLDSSRLSRLIAVYTHCSDCVYLSLCDFLFFSLSSLLLWRFFRCWKIPKQLHIAYFEAFAWLFRFGLLFVVRSICVYIFSVMFKSFVLSFTLCCSVMSQASISLLLVLMMISTRVGHTFAVVYDNLAMNRNERINSKDSVQNIDWKGRFCCIDRDTNTKQNQKRIILGQNSCNVTP